METIEFMQLRINALENENKRLNEELKKVKTIAFKVKLSDPNFDKPLSGINYEIISKT